MSVKALRKFGALRRVFRGTGIVKFSDDSDVRVRFTLGQFTDTKLLIYADLDRQPLGFLAGRLEAQSLQGTLTDGRKLRATDLLIIENHYSLGSGKARFVARSGYWTITGPSTDSPKSVVFELVNFLYTGTEYETQVVNGLEHSVYSLMIIVLGNRQVQLRWIQDYKQAVAKLKAQSGVLVTCTATTAITAESEIAEVALVMDKLCDLMSVARGTLVSWTSFEVRTAGGVSPHSQYRNSVTRRYAGIELVDDSDSHGIRNFLETGFRQYEERGETFRLRKVARAFIETRNGLFAETRALSIAVLVEYLANILARLEGRVYFLKPEDFDNGWRSFEAKARAALLETYFKDSSGKKKSYLDPMLKNMKGINNRLLKFRIERLLAWLGIGYAPGEVDEFVAARDLLTHESRFPDGGTSQEHCRKMQHFLDRIILRLFDYHGTYYDLEHGETRRI